MSNPVTQNDAKAHNIYVYMVTTDMKEGVNEKSFFAKIWITVTERATSCRINRTLFAVNIYTTC